MRPGDAAIYSRAMKFSSMAENGNSVRDCAELKIIDRGDGTVLINARRLPGLINRDLGAGPPQVKPSTQHRLDCLMLKNETVKQCRQDMQSD